MFHPVRMLLTQNLYHFGLTSFSDLKKLLEISDGNLSSHLKALIDNDIIIRKKEIINDKFVTQYKLSTNGLFEYRGFIKSLKTFAGKLLGEVIE
jgi:DNA-binding HxlR family transcriptional regulator